MLIAGDPPLQVPLRIITANVSAAAVAAISWRSSLVLIDQQHASLGEALDGGGAGSAPAARGSPQSSGLLPPVSFRVVGQLTPQSRSPWRLVDRWSISAAAWRPGGVADYMPSDKAMSPPPIAPPSDG